MARVKDQLGMDERVVENKGLEGLLEKRLRLGDDLSEIRKSFADADAEARGGVEALNLDVGDVVRVGRFRIEKRESPPREVSFTTEAKTRVSIKLTDDE